MVVIGVRSSCARTPTRASSSGGPGAVERERAASSVPGWRSMDTASASRTPGKVASATVRLSGTLRPPSGLGFLDQQGQADLDRGALPRAGRHDVDDPAMGADDAARGIQAEAEPGDPARSHALRASEPAEHRLAFLVREPHPVVADRQSGHPVALAQSDLDGPAVRRVLDGVADDVADDPAELVGVPVADEPR